MMGRTGSEPSMPDGAADRPAGMPGQPCTDRGGTARETWHAQQTGAVGEEPAGKWSPMNIEEVLRRENMQDALKRVKQNQGAPGVDGMTVDELAPALVARWEAIRKEILEDRYQPQPVRKVEIPKPDGKGTRTLGIPTVIDRLIQQALLQVLQPHFDATFSDGSFGFRPGRSAHQAIERAREHIADGYRWVVDMDLEKFFDRVNHDVLMSRLARRIEDKRVLHLIRRYLTAGMMEGGLVSERTQGTPQGGPLSPLLSNVLLDELDKELERRGHRFARYADDCNVYVQSKAAGERVMASVERFLSEVLRLKVNREKSAVDRPWNRKFLGFTFTTNFQPRVKVSPQSVKRFKDNFRAEFRRGRGRNLGSFIKELAPSHRGWMAYYRIAEVKATFEELDSWIRRKLRCILWRQWKRPRTRYRELIARGLSPEQAKLSAGNGFGPWWNAGASHMNLAVPGAFLSKLGLVSFLGEHLRLKRPL
jgi:RNA-directed DNA polymerase